MLLPKKRKKEITMEEPLKDSLKAKVTNVYSSPAAAMDSPVFLLSVNALPIMTLDSDESPTTIIIHPEARSICLTPIFNIP